VGYTGDGFINTVNENGVGITWEVNVTESGTYTLEWRYANGSSTNRTAQVEVDGNVVVSNVDFQPTGSWDNWDEVSIDVTLSQGTRQIRLEATNSSGLPNIDYISITLKEGGTQVVHVTGVSVEPTTASIGVGETVQLTATVEPSNATNKNVTWSSSNTSVATVSSSGLVTGKSAGTATITATTEDGGYMATCEITVTEEVFTGNVEIIGSWVGGSTHSIESGSNRVLILTVHAEDDNSDMHATVTYGGQVMTKVIESNYAIPGDPYRAYAAIFMLDETGISAASGNEFSISWEQSPSRGANYTSVFLSGVDQSSPIGATSSNGANTSTISTDPLPTNESDIVILAGTNGNTGTYSLNNGFIKGVEVDVPSADGVSGYKYATGAYETPSITHSNSKRHTICAAVIRAASGGTQVVHVTGVSVRPTTASIGVGETVQLTATVEPSNATNKNVTWSSSNPWVATVSSSGLVTGESAGTATITVTTEDGGYKATCEVTVTEEGQGGQIAIVPDGYGRNATGGGDVAPITVTSASEFKSAVSNNDPAVIYVGGRFDLGGDVSIGSNKTIIGVGESSGLYGGTIKIQGNNYIIANLTFGPSDGDVMEISGATNVFITHCAFHDSKDELCSVVREADYVTISWCHFWFDNPDDHSYAHLIGNSDSRTSDRGKLHVTLHHNWYDNGVKGRQPRVRFGHVHVYNCYYSSNNTDYCIGAGKECHIRVENTYFDNVDDPFADYGGSDDGEIGWNNCVFDGCSEPDFMPNSYPVFDLPYNFNLDPVANVPSIVMNNCGPKSDLLLSKKIAYDNSKSINVIVIPETYGISNPYPNPFNPVTIFRYQLPLTSHIDIKIYDLLGKEILTLEKGMKQAGIYEVQFDGTNLQSGVYLMRFVARSEDGSEHYVQVKKMLLVK